MMHTQALSLISRFNKFYLFELSLKQQNNTNCLKQAICFVRLNLYKDLDITQLQKNNHKLLITFSFYTINEDTALQNAYSIRN